MGKPGQNQRLGRENREEEEEPFPADFLELREYRTFICSLDELQEIAQLFSSARIMHLPEPHHYKLLQLH